MYNAWIGGKDHSPADRQAADDVAQAIDPRCRVVYVDYDPGVVAYARALMASGPEGACGYVEGADVYAGLALTGRRRR